MLISRLCVNETRATSELFHIRGGAFDPCRRERVNRENVNREMAIGERRVQSKAPTADQRRGSLRAIDRSRTAPLRFETLCLFIEWALLFGGIRESNVIRGGYIIFARDASIRCTSV